MKTNNKIYIFSLRDVFPQWYLYSFCDIYIRKYYHSAINNIMYTLLKEHTILTYLADTLLNCGFLRIKQQRRRISFSFRYIKQRRRRVIRTNVQERLATFVFLWSPSFPLAIYLLSILRNSIHCLGIEILNSGLFTRRTFSPHPTLKLQQFQSCFLPYGLKQAREYFC